VEDGGGEGGGQKEGEQTEGEGGAGRGWVEDEGRTEGGVVAMRGTLVRYKISGGHRKRTFGG